MNFDGLIDEVSIYARALSDYEIATLANAGLTTCPTLSGLASPSQDLDADGLCEDINGNGLSDFGDIVTLFQQIDSPEVQDNAATFDFNGNGLADMGDVVELFTRLVS